MNTSKPKPKYAAHGEPEIEAWIEVYADTCAEAEQRHKIYAHAPELLAALEAIVANPDMADGEEPRRLIATARAAIAKATGQ